MCPTANTGKHGVQEGPYSPQSWKQGSLYLNYSYKLHGLCWTKIVFGEFEIKVFAMQKVTSIKMLATQSLISFLST